MAGDDYIMDFSFVLQVLGVIQLVVLRVWLLHLS